MSHNLPIVISIVSFGHEDFILSNLKTNHNLIPENIKVVITDLAKDKNFEKELNNGYFTMDCHRCFGLRYLLSD